MIRPCVSCMSSPFRFTTQVCFVSPCCPHSVPICPHACFACWAAPRAAQQPHGHCGTPRGFVRVGCSTTGAVETETGRAGRWLHEAMVSPQATSLTPETYSNAAPGPRCPRATQRTPTGRTHTHKGTGGLDVGSNAYQEGQQQAPKA